MSEEKKYKNYTAADIEKYHRGLLSPGEMNELEKAALDDPFLADALDGYGATAVNISSDISELEKKLEERVSDKKVVSIAPSGSSFKWWKAAAAVVILGGLGYFIFQVSTDNKNNEVAAKVEEKKSKAPVSTITTDSNRSTTVESTSVVANKKTPAKSNLEMKETIIPKSNANANKEDLATEISKPSQPTANYKQQKDSTTVDRLSGVSAPAAMEKRSVAADDKQNEGSRIF